ncbi:MAG: hypothetical protein WCJ19_05210 [bacterium]
MKNKNENKLIQYLRSESVDAHPSDIYVKNLKSKLESELHIKNKKMNLIFKITNKVIKQKLLLVGIASIFLVLVAVASVIIINVKKTQLLSPEVQQLKDQAYARFAEINHGLTYEEIQAIYTAQNNGEKINIDEKLKVNKSEVQYVESEVYYDKENAQKYGNQLSFNLMPFTYDNPIFIKNKPIKIQMWYSPVFTKYVVTQDNKVINFGVRTDNYQITYLGGKYAIKENFFSSKQFSSNSYSDDEMNFLTSVITNASNYKYIGKDNINGANVNIYESSSDVTSTHKEIIRYYINMDKTSLEKEEVYFNDKLVQVMNVTFKSNSNNLDTLLQNSEKEINGIEIKTVQEPDYESAMSNNDKQLQDYVKNHKLFYLVNAKGALTTVMDAESINNINIYNTKDFNPDYKIDDASLYKDYAYYYQNNGNIDYTISKNESYFADANEFDFETSTITISIDGKPTDVKFLKQIRKLNSSDYYYTISFKSLDRWYKINIYNSDSNTFNNELKDYSIKSLSVEDAIKMDKQRVVDQNSMPNTKLKKLSEINNNIRLLPGNLMDTNSMFAISVLTAETKTSEYSCNNVYDQVYNSTDCLIEMYSGYKIQFYKSCSNACTNQRPEEQIHMEYTVLQVNSDSIKKYTDKLAPNHYVKGVGNLTIIITGNISADEMKTVAEGSALDKGLNELIDQTKDQFKNQHIGG